jgi:hypothetical protein
MSAEPVVAVPMLEHQVAETAVAFDAGLLPHRTDLPPRRASGTGATGHWCAGRGDAGPHARRARWARPAGGHSCGRGRTAGPRAGRGPRQARPLRPEPCRALRTRATSGWAGTAARGGDRGGQAAVAVCGVMMISNSMGVNRPRRAWRRRRW